MGNFSKIANSILLVGPPGTGKERVEFRFSLPLASQMGHDSKIYLFNCVMLRGLVFSFFSLIDILF